MKTRIMIFLVLLVMLVSSGCQPNVTTPTSAVEAPTSPAAPSSAAPTFAPVVAPGKTLSIFMIDWTKPFADKVDLSDDLTLGAWIPSPYMGQDLPLPFSYDLIANDEVIDKLTADQKTSCHRMVSQSSTARRRSLATSVLKQPTAAGSPTT